MKQRIEYIDAIKGFTILCVILGHLCDRVTNGDHNMMLSFIYTWHMGLFFLASGLVVNNKKAFKDFLFGKFKFILWPYLIFSFISPFFDSRYELSNYFLTQGKGGLWFLPCLFTMLLFLYIIDIQRIKQGGGYGCWQLLWS